MPNLFANIGASNALSETSNNLSNLALGIRKMKDEEAYKAAFLTIEDRRARSQEALQKANTVMLQKQVEALDKQEASLNKVIPLSNIQSMFGNAGAGKAASDFIENYSNVKDYNGVKGITVRDLQAAMNLHKGNQEVVSILNNNLRQGTLNGYIEQKNAIMKQWEAEKNPQKKLELKKQALEVDNQIANIGEANIASDPGASARVKVAEIGADSKKDIAETKVSQKAYVLDNYTKMNTAGLFTNEKEKTRAIEELSATWEYGNGKRTLESLLSVFNKYSKAEDLEEEVKNIKKNGGGIEGIISSIKNRIFSGSNTGNEVGKSSKQITPEEKRKASQMGVTLEYIGDDGYYHGKDKNGKPIKLKRKEQ